jgi:bifunctional non-homologous end joining protein LigD
MKSFFDDLPTAARSQLKRRDPPEWIEPMLATLADEPFSDENWIFERKLDGERCLAFRHGDRVRLLSRNRKSLNDTYPELVESIAQQSTDRFVVDGEVVAFEGHRTSFARLQQRMQLKDPQEVRQSKVAVFYYVFDIPYLDGYDLTALPLRQRKTRLKRAVDFSDPLRFTSHRNADGKTYYNEVCDKGWEGLIAKDSRGSYVHSRSKKWLKFKCVNRQEFVIGGYTDPQGERIGFGALLIGYYAGDDLIYAGKVGTGYDDETLRRMSQQLSRLERQTPAFTDDDLPSKNVHWVTPELVGEVKFTEWTQDGKLRHPSFLGLRRDKNPQDVVKEEPPS